MLSLKSKCFFSIRLLLSICHCISFSVLVAGLSYADINDGLIAYYHFNGDTNDSSGLSNHGNPQGGIQFTNGVLGQSVIFDGIDDIISISTNTGLRPDYYSLSFWIKTSTTEWVVPFSGLYSIGASNNCGFEVYLNYKDDLKGFLGKIHSDNMTAATGNWGAWSATNINDDKWHHIAITFDGRISSLYFDSVLEGQFDSNLYPQYPKGPIRWSSPYSDFLFGYTVNSVRANSGLFSHFQGQIDEFRYYNRPIDQQEIYQLYSENPDIEKRDSDFLEMVIPSSISYNTAFEITIRAKDKLGNLLANNSERVYLTSNCGSVIPSAVDLVNGIFTDDIELTGESLGCQIFANTKTIATTPSRLLNIIGDFLIKGKLQGKVTDSVGQPLEGAKVFLKGISFYHSESTVSAADGSYNFSELLPGVYVLYAVLEEGLLGKWSKKNYEIQLNTGINTGVDLKIRSKKPPVVLIPGFFGSDRKWRLNIVPSLPKEDYPDQDDLKIHDPGSDLDIPHFNLSHFVNWEDLRDKLRESGFEVFDCPWDWRKRPDVWRTRKYLKDVIDDAKASSGYDKVDIIAHSMGGILARSYIINDSFRNDVDRFAMVGTPNKGTYLAYPPWEGGDPILTDNMKGDTGIYNEINYFNSQSINKDYKNKYDTELIDFFDYELRPSLVPPFVGQSKVYKIPEQTVTYEKTKEYIQSDIPLLRTVMPFHDFLRDGNGTYEVTDPREPEDLRFTGNTNNVLPDLNSKYNTDLLNNRVMTRIFASASEKTIYGLNVDRSNNEIYTDGAPVKPFLDIECDYPIKWGEIEDGDSLTPLSGVVWDSISNEHTNISYDFSVGGVHGNLIDKYRVKLIEFLLEGRTVDTYSINKDINANKIETDKPTSLLSLFTSESTKILVTDPNGEQNGIFSDGSLVNQSTNSNIHRSGAGMNILIASPEEGEYSIDVSGAKDERIEIEIQYISSTNKDEISIPLILDNSTKKLNITLSPTAENVLTLLTMSPFSLNLHALSNEGKTKLIWEQTIDNRVNEYKLYSKVETDPFFRLIATIPSNTTFYQTDHEFGGERKLYSISCVDQDGNESILSESVANVDRVSIKHVYQKKFQWNIFLPSIMNQKQ